jgi:hypothetical protein
MPVASGEVVGIAGTPGAAKAARGPGKRWRVRGAPTPTRGHGVVPIGRRQMRRRNPWAKFYCLKPQKYQRFHQTSQLLSRSRKPSSSARSTFPGRIRTQGVKADALHASGRQTASNNCLSPCRGQVKFSLATSCSYLYDCHPRPVSAYVLTSHREAPIAWSSMRYKRAHGRGRADRPPGPARAGEDFG